ncbi:retron Ec67 family RNA-directed DNA polymerase/endonuclease [Streptococcus orisasini]|uniref:retron Ec67 family RNA-directed DNA polymerase/endonuclease n=1 Tax=Streptococcus orisasini TaxID=1080071 RepID=UPI0007106D89|nr:retron Ec67 family RNA-directed DNA polymerase/endonuclease [Streptococcus orisasini]
MNKLQTIQSKEDFAHLLGYKKYSSITYLLYKIGIDNLYTSFEIPKKTGGTRTIYAPQKALKKLQKRFASLLWEAYVENFQPTSNKKHKKLPNVSHAFEKNKSIITNAKRHRNKKFVLNLDLEDFFGSFHFGRVRGFFLKNRDFQVPEEVATLIAQLTCYKGSLPQGAPSSPIITNLICQILDHRIVKLAKKYRLTYTRYADDLTFSTNAELPAESFEAFFTQLQDIIHRSGFSINHRKTRISDNGQRQEVTGLIVNKKVNIKREYFKNTKAMAFHLYKDGQFEIDGKPGTIDQLNGRFAYIQQIENYNNYLLYKKSLSTNGIEYQKYLLPKYENKKGRDNFYHHYIFNEQDLVEPTNFWNSKHKKYELPQTFYKAEKNSNYNYMENFSSREKEYQKFLFFKNFFMNNRPLIVTEGKTDIVYLKAALKNLASKYPSLIEKEDNQFNFKINFFSHTATIDYLFNIPKGGGEVFKHLYNYFSDNTGIKQQKYLYPNYLKYFRELTSREPKNPTFFLFDNEPKGNPLYNFANHARDLKLDSQTLDILRINAVDIFVKNNLFLLLIPLLSGKSSSDIEDLLLAEQSMPILNNKSFSKNNNDEGRNSYSKEILSKYILRHYQSFNFNKFIPLFDALEKRILEYKESTK